MPSNPHKYWVLWYNRYMEGSTYDDSKYRNIQTGRVIKSEEIQETTKPDYIEKSIGITTFDGKEYHINDIDPSHATQIEMFAYLSYMDHKGLSGNHGMSSYSKMKAYANMPRKR